MSLPIDTEAIAAQAKAEHEYGERLMDLAQERALCANREVVLAEDIEWASMRALKAIGEQCAALELHRLRCICAERLGVK